MCPLKHRHGATIFMVIPRNRPFSRFLRHAGDTEDTFSTKPRFPKGGWWRFKMVSFKSSVQYTVMHVSFYYARLFFFTKQGCFIKQGLQKYCEIAYSRSGSNQMWILKNSKELLDHLKSPNFNLITIIKSFDFSTLYTTIPHQKLKSRLATIIRNSFIHTKMEIGDTNIWF